MGQRLEAVRHELTVPNHCQVIVYMMFEMEKDDAFFKPYYDTLPADFKNFPIFWEKEELEWLEGSVLRQQVLH